jgi:hypothetical protein
MTADPRLPRWTEEGSEAPAELRQWLRASREQAGALVEVAQLAHSLAQRLGPEAGLVAAASHVPIAAGKLWFSAGRWAAWLAASAGSVAVIWYLVSAPAPGPAPGAAAPAPPAPATVAEPPAPSAPAPVLEAPAPVLEAPAVAAPEPAAPARQRDLHAVPRTDSRARPREEALLERAQSALAAHPDRALALAAEHRRLFTRGVLAEEREAIAIEALRRLGREQEATRRAAAFVAKYPNSVHRSRVQVTPAPR